MRVAKFSLGEFKLGDRTETFYVYTFPTLPNYLTSDKRPAHPGTQPRPPLYYRVKDIVAIFLTKYPEYINHCIPVLQGFDPFYTIERQGGELFIMVSALQSIAYKFPDQPHLGSFCNFHLEEFQRGQANNVLLSLGFTRIARPVTQVDDDIPVTLTEKQRSYQPPASATGPSTAYSRSSPTSHAVNMARGTTTPATTGYPEQTRSPHYGHLPRPATGGPHPNHLSREVNHTHEGIIHKPAYPSPYPAGRPRSQHDAREYDPHRHPYHSPYDGHEVGNGPAPKRQRSNPRPDSSYPALPSPMNPYGPSHVQGRSGPPPTMSPTHARDAAAAASRNALNLTVYTAYDDQPTARPTDAPYSAQQPAPRSAVPVHHKPYPPPPTSHAGYPLPSPRPTVQASAAAPPMPHHLAHRGPASSPLRPGPPTGTLPRSRLNSDGASTHRSPPDHNVQLPPLQAASSTTPATASPADRALSETLEAVRSQMERLIQLEQRLNQQLHQSTKILSELERQTPAGPAFWMRMRSLVRDVVAGNEDATTTAEVIPALTTDPLALLADNACADPPAATVESPVSASMTMSPFSPATKSVAVSGSSGTNGGSPTAGASTVSSNVTDSLPSPANDADPSSSSISSTLASTELRSSLPPAELPPSALTAPVVPTSAPVLQNS
ncbi:hypothetical protein IWQ60_011999 [Tieghemiomyces parasiticus]|uniref:Uncharacterized protein n=1 Tax=Tieghemiomyces parasiticus TaxID=78921 RepID=A0A9W8DL10_9FUNG|nr:hypothetical protein IWQ60_011999 [Tieghemiomyces parasiticus]